MASAEQPVQLDIVSRLQAAFSPIHLQIENESYKHSVPKGSETHFKVRKNCQKVAIFSSYIRDILCPRLPSF